jgi:hypothetical protein
VEEEKYSPDEEMSNGNGLSEFPQKGNQQQISNVTKEEEGAKALFKRLTKVSSIGCRNRFYRHTYIKIGASIQSARQ